MKRFIAICAAAVTALTLTACGEKKIYIEGTSSKYIGTEMSDTMYNMQMTMTAAGAEIDAVRYFGDDVCNDKAIETMKERVLIPQDSEAKDCIGYAIDYHYSRSPVPMVRNLLGGKFDLEEHTDFQIWFVKNENADDGEEWELVSIGDEVI